MLRRRSLRQASVAASLALLAASASSCRRAPREAAQAAPPKDCSYDIVRPEKSARTAQFRAWLKPRAKELIDDAAPVDQSLDVYVADIDNDGEDEYVPVTHQGSGGYLYMWVFRRTSDGWAPAKDVPFEDQLTGGHDYRGPRMEESELLVRFCGTTYVNFEGGDHPNYYPVSLVWQGGKTRTACDAPWLRYQRRAFQDLFDRKLYDEAHELLDGVQDRCQRDADPAIWLAMQGDLALAAERMETYGDCLEHVAAAEARPALAKADAQLRKTLGDDRARCEAAKTKAAAAAGATYDFSWVLSEAKRDPQAQLVLDQRFDGLLTAIVPEAKLDGQFVRDALKLALWLPEPAAVIGGRYVIISGCQPHNCGNKAFIWIDTAAKQAIVMTGGTLASKTTAPSKIPPEFWKQTKAVVGRFADSTIDYVDVSGTAKKINVR